MQATKLQQYDVQTISLQINSIVVISTYLWYTSVRGVDMEHML